MKKTFYLIVALQILIAFCQALSQDREEWIRHFNSGVRFQIKSEYKKAVNEFEYCIKIWPQNVDAFKNLCYSYIHLGNSRKVLEVCNKGLQIKPNDNDLIRVRRDFTSKVNSKRKNASDFESRRDNLLNMFVTAGNSYKYESLQVREYNTKAFIRPKQTKRVRTSSKMSGEQKMLEAWHNRQKQTKRVRTSSNGEDFFNRDTDSKKSGEQKFLEAWHNRSKQTNRVRTSSNGEDFFNRDTDRAQVREYNIKTLTVPKPTYPVHLTAELAFSETSNNGFLDAEETGKLLIALSNKGKGDAYNLQVEVVQQTNMSGITIKKPSLLKKLPAGEIQTIEISILAHATVSSKEIKLKVKVNEANGFDLDPPAYITFNTKAFIPPNFELVDVGINDQSGNSMIEPREVVEITARIQNTGQGNARSVVAYIKTGKNVFLTGDSKNVFVTNELRAGEFKDFTFSVYTNSRATGVPVEIEIKEAHEKFNKKLPLSLPFNRRHKSATKLIVKGKENAPKKISDVAMLSIDVDIKIPQTTFQNSDAIAVIIGNQNYINRDVPAVDYAAHDAQIMREYLLKTLGYKYGNIIFKTDATKADFERIFGTEKNYRGKLYNWVKPNKSDVFVYYSGHGAPDPNTKQAYFLPVNCEPSYVHIDGYPMETFYANLKKIPAKKITVILDACFSGGSDAGNLLPQISSLVIVPRIKIFGLSNAVIMTSSSSDQVSSWYPEKKHSLFTYYFLKGLRGDADKDNNRSLTYQELFDFVMENVPYMARRLNGREQIPTMQGDNDAKVLVTY